MLPLVASELLNAQLDLTCAMDVLRTRCINGIVVNRARTSQLTQYSLGKLSAIAARDGYATATHAVTATGALPVANAVGRDLETEEPQAAQRLRTEQGRIDEHHR
jgi:aspartate ammonia-lyase